MLANYPKMQKYLPMEDVKSVTQHKEMDQQTRGRMKGCEVIGGQQLDLCYFIQPLTSVNFVTFTFVKHFYFAMNSTVEKGVLQVSPTTLPAMCSTMRQGEGLIMSLSRKSHGLYGSPLALLQHQAVFSTNIFQGPSWHYPAFKPGLG
ncbi:uncharacterized protein LJ206_000753 [Theristicus caerulescens]